MEINERRNSTKKRTTSDGITSSPYYEYAVNRTGVNMPNCFTYATFRISEIVNHNQSLDGVSRVVGAGDLWEHHSVEFSQTSEAIPGALAIWQGTQYGHVSVVEVVGEQMLTSQSNYGGSFFETVQVPKTVGTRYPSNPALRLVGFLIHKDLNVKPKANYRVGYTAHVQGSGWQKEVYDGQVAGTTGKKLRLEAFKIESLNGHTIENVKIHIQGKGWVTYKAPDKNTVIGTTGKKLRLECLCIKCSGLKYRAHIQGSGWSSWTNADGISTVGSVGQSLRIEAIEMIYD